ncbi:hypothetical protein D1007_43776 [Hordeum vulgare]|nr:hypothetical protein D1007_43776 [Hordeum vulgare]
MGTITCGNCGLQGHWYTNNMKQLKPELALRKNKHVPTARNSNAAGAAPTPPPRVSNPAPTPPPRASNPAPTTAGTGGAGRVAAGRSGARRGAGRGGGRGARRDAGRGAGKGSRAFYAPRQSAAPQPSDGRHSGWRSYFYASGNY